MENDYKSKLVEDVIKAERMAYAEAPYRDQLIATRVNYKLTPVAKAVGLMSLSLDAEYAANSAALEYEYKQSKTEALLGLLGDAFDLNNKENMYSERIETKWLYKD